jgi:BirA family transcriptional regulator, biotin operon repressor / biotin---[acetyl-CoA-carboxylase] ligase
VELGRLAYARGVRLLPLGDIDSTNEEAKRLIAAGETGPLWIVAERQTQGKGRLGRDWSSMPGNLHASLILSGLGGAAIAPQLGFVAGVAALNAIGDGAGRIALKWPNDLLLNGAKLGGILLEGVASAFCGFAAVIGIGINCAAAPQGLPYPAAALSALGADAPMKESLFSRLSDAFVETLDIWAEGAGFPRIREMWLAGAAGLGAPATVALARGESVEGRFETIDSDGRLVLATAQGRRVIDAGDVRLAHAEAPATSAEQ